MAGRRAARIRRGRLLLAATGLVLVALAAAVWISRSRGVVLAPSAGAPIRRGETVLWCAASQLAWDAMADLVGRGTLDVGAPASADVVRDLNRRSFPHDAIDRDAVVVCAGIGPPGPTEADRAAFRRLLGGEAPTLDPVTSPDTAYAYAGLAKGLPFAVAFETLEDPLRFSPPPLGVLSGRHVKAFGWQGVPAGTAAGGAASLLDAVTVLFDDGDPGGFALEIRAKDPADRVVLARVEPGTTLDATWDGVDRRARATSPYPIAKVPRLGVLSIPVIAVEVDRQFTEFARAPIRNAIGQPARIDLFAEWVRFRLDERGAEVRALAKAITMPLGMGDHPEPPRRDFRFDRPFLVALRRAEATRPYFLMWVGNADVLVPSGD